MKQNSFEKKLNKVLTEEEHYVLNIQLLSYLTDDDRYKDVAELCFMFDEYSNFKRFIKYYGGKTIKVPTQKELRLSLKHLLLFQYVKIEGKDFNRCYKDLRLEEYGVSREEAMETISKFYTYIKENGNNIGNRKRNRLF